MVARLVVMEQAQQEELQQHQQEQRPQEQHRQEQHRQERHRSEQRQQEQRQQEQHQQEQHTGRSCGSSSSGSRSRILYRIPDPFAKCTRISPPAAVLGPLHLRARERSRRVAPFSAPVGTACSRDEPTPTWQCVAHGALEQPARFVGEVLLLGARIG